MQKQIEELVLERDNLHVRQKELELQICKRNAPTPAQESLSARMSEMVDRILVRLIYWFL